MEDWTQAKKNKKIKLKEVGTRLRQWRKEVPLKSFELAQIIRVSQGSLSEIENNKSLPSSDTLTALHIYTDCNILWLLVGEEQNAGDKIRPTINKEPLTITVSGGSGNVRIVNKLGKK